MKTNLLPKVDRMSLPGMEARVGDEVMIVGNSEPKLASLSDHRFKVGIIEEVHFLGLSRMRAMGELVFIANLNDLVVVGRNLELDDDWLQKVCP